MEFRHYEDKDYEALCEFLIALNRNDPGHINWNWARLEWMYEHPEFDKDARGSIGLWFDGEQIVGAAIYDMYFGEAFCGALPAYAALYPEAADYAWRALRDENGLGIAINDKNETEIAVLQAAGFAKAEQTETILARPLEKLPTATLPDGLKIAELDPIRDAEALQWLFWRGFNHGEDRAEFEREEEIVPQIRKHFDPRISLVACAPDGDLIACCGLWYHPATDYAYVEPVCTVPAWRGRGIAKALLSEAMRRAGELGAKTAYVISDLEFYKRLGFSEAEHFTFWWKN